VQFLLNAMNANTATISRGYAEGVIQTYNSLLLSQGIHASVTQVAASDITRRGEVQLRPAFLYNPASWIPGSS